MENQSMTFSQMLNFFETNGYVETNSPKNRKKLYRYLEEKGIPFTTKIVGYSKGKKDLCRWTSGRKIGWDLGRIVKWIDAKRILPEDLQPYCNDIFKFDDIKDVFNEQMSNRERYDLIKDKWNDPYDSAYKYTPFDRPLLRTTIVRIVNINTIQSLLKGELPQDLINSIASYI